MNPSFYKSAVHLRGDCLYCPLPLCIDSYWSCETDCHHCYLRRLNRTWGNDLRPADPDDVRRTLEKGLVNKRGKSSLTNALRLKKTLRLGNKSDPYQPAEASRKVSRRIQRHLVELEWSYVIQSRHLSLLQRDEDVMERAHRSGLLTIMPVISPGAERDWELLERSRTTPVEERLTIIQGWIRRGWNVGVNGEPFIPGFHTVGEFRGILRRLKSVGVRSYNTYNLHLNDWVAKRFVEIGLDLEKIWRENQDDRWRPVQRRLCEIAQEEGMQLGCPDFVNVGWDYRQPSNTCCGVRVPNPSRYNAHHFVHLIQKGKSLEEVHRLTWEGIGEESKGRVMLQGDARGDFFTLGDVHD